jgi:hypothetical protein
MRSKARLLGALLLFLVVGGSWVLLHERGAETPESSLIAHPSPEPPGPSLAAIPEPPLRTSDLPEKPWWFQGTVKAARASAKSSRVEAAWWSTKPASPFAEPEAVFTSADIDISGGMGTFRLAGNARAGWAVLFVEVDGQRVPARPFMSPFVQVEPGFGYGDPAGERGVVPIVAGASNLRVLALDRGGKPVEGLEVDARVPDTQQLQRAVTNAEGRVWFSGFLDGQATVSWRKRSSGDEHQTGEALADEFADGEARLVTWTDGEEVVVRAARNPWVRVRVRIDDAPDDAWCPVRNVRVEGARGSGVVYEGAHGFFLPPGTWRGHAYIFGAGDVPFVTPMLALDAEATVEARVVLQAAVPWLDVSFAPRPSAGTRVACAIEARDARAEGGWAGTQAAGPHPHLVVPCPEGEYVLTGAIRVDGAVGISNPQRLVIGKGDRLTISLATATAGGVVAPPTAATMEWNDKLELLERAFPGTGIIEDAGFRFAYLGNRVRATMWWMPPGTYTLVRRGDAGELARVTLDVKPGDVLRVVEEHRLLRVAGE